MMKRPFSTINMQRPIRAVNKFIIPTRLNKCKYELVAYNVIRRVIVTETVNREVILEQLIKYVIGIKNPVKKRHNLAFKIFLTENKERTLLLCSRKHKSFISSFYENKERLHYPNMDL